MREKEKRHVDVGVELKKLVAFFFLYIQLPSSTLVDTSMHRKHTYRYPGEAGRPAQRDLRGSEERVDGGASKTSIEAFPSLCFAGLLADSAVNQR